MPSQYLIIRASSVGAKVNQNALVVIAAEENGNTKLVVRLLGDGILHIVSTKDVVGVGFSHENGSTAIQIA